MKNSGRRQNSEHNHNIDYQNTDEPLNKEEDAKSEEDEAKAKECGERVIDKDEIAFFERLKNRLDNKPTEKEILMPSENNGATNMRRLSIAIPSLVSRQNTLIKQKEFFSRQNSLLPKLSRTPTLRNLPDSVRQPTFVKQIEAIRRENDIVPTEESKVEDRRTRHKDKIYKEVISQLENFLDSTGTIVVMGIATLFVLFIVDITSLALPLSYDFGMDVAKTICFGLFIVEIILSCIAKTDYIFNFFFWLDVISTLSLIQDINFMINPLINPNYGYDP